MTSEDVRARAESALNDLYLLRHQAVRDTGGPRLLDVLNGLEGSVRALLSALEASAVSSPPTITDRPEVVTLCGSTRFYDEFQEANYRLTMQGKIVLSVGFYPHAKAQHGHGEGVGHDSMEKVALDELHKRKIDMSDRVLVLNVGGYIGESTRSEIEHAHRVGVPVDYIEPVAALHPGGETNG